MKARPRVGLIVTAPPNHQAAGHQGQIIGLSLDGQRARVQWYYNVGDTPQPAAAAPACSAVSLPSVGDAAAPAIATDNTLFT